MHLRLPAPLAMTCVRPHLKCMLSLELASETFQTASSNLTISISKSFSKTGYTIHSPLFVLTIVEIEDFALRVAILDDRECQICFGGRPLGSYIRKRQDGRPSRQIAQSCSLLRSRN